MEKYRIDKSIAYNKKLRHYLPGGAHYNFRTFGEEPPVHFTHGRGSRLFDMDDNEYLDLHCKFGPLIVGHNNPEYNRLLAGQLEKVQSVHRCDLDMEVCELITRHVPGVDMVRFGLSGTEIVQNALRLARGYTKKNRFVRFLGHYHGSADNIVGGVPEDDEWPVPVDHQGDPRGTDGRAARIMESQSFLLPWNDAEKLENLVTRHHDEIAAIITEPILINGGGIMPRQGYLQTMRDLCDKYHIVLIYDEVITGFRVALGGAQELVKVPPDLITFGKAIASGMPVSVLGGKREIMKLYQQKKVMHAGTFNGYALGMAAIKATIGILSRDNGAAYGHMKRSLGRIKDVFLSRAGEIGFPLVIQGTDTIGIFHCREKPLENVEDMDYVDQIRDSALYKELFHYGILVAPVSRMYMNTMCADDDVAFFSDRVGFALAEAKKILEQEHML